MGVYRYKKEQLELGLKRLKYYINSIMDTKHNKYVMANTASFTLTKEGILFEVIDKSGYISATYLLDDWMNDLEVLTQDAIDRGLNPEDLMLIYEDAFYYLFVGE